MRSDIVLPGVYETINIEEGRPTADEAVRRLTYHIHEKTKRGVIALKIIHGFGSSGTGGKIRVKSRDYLEELKRRNVICDFIPGESFSIFDPASRKLLDACPQMRKDPDLERHNNGITIIHLAKQKKG